MRGRPPVDDRAVFGLVLFVLHSPIVKVLLRLWLPWARELGASCTGLKQGREARETDQQP